MHLPVNLRPLSLNLFSNNTVPYINNAISTVPIPPLPASSFHSVPLGSLAFRIRKTILSYVDDVDELRKDLIHWLANPVKVSSFTPDGDFEIMSNWQSANFNRLDFSGACVNDKDKSDGETKVVFVVDYIAGFRGSKRGVGFIVSEDGEAVWISAYRGRKEWEAIRRGGEVAFLG